MEASGPGEEHGRVREGDPNPRLNACLNKEASGRTRQESRLLEPGEECLGGSRAVPALRLLVQQQERSTRQAHRLTRRGSLGSHGPGTPSRF